MGLSYWSRALWTVLISLSLRQTAHTAPEPWADTKLPVTQNLELWFDASRAHGADAATPGETLSRWRDASGAGRDVEQPMPGAQPTLIAVGDAAIVRFDGQDDHLRAVQLNQELESFTLVVVAAPRRNFGGFQALAAFNAAGARDFTSGMTLDMGAAATSQFSALNVEGRGFTGARNLRKGQSAFGRLHRIVVASDAARGAVELLVDGEAEGERRRSESPLSGDELTLGARFYTHGAGPQQVNGFGSCDVAEVLLYSRRLTAEELTRVDEYLRAKYAAVSERLPAEEGAGTPLEVVKDAPPVQFLVPGFEIRQLPIELTNVNNVKYRSDGTLVALGYDGKIWLLRDTDGDGVEDAAALFWDNPVNLRSAIGMDLTPPEYPHGDGVFLVGKTRCLLVADTDGDGRADKEVDLAEKWKESFHQVDGLGVAFDARDGSVYYGRGTYNFADPYLRDQAGKSQYRLDDESSAVIRVAPDFKSREIVATGIRFPVALRFNSEGDLFATDQEGATWLANGNPLDELLHIQRGRHYGFPPRHPAYLPAVIDEPSTFDYGPQHQSTCGLNFNLPVNSVGRIFGPASWEGDAFVTGYSRGKLYRTELVKTPAGYVARNHLLACLKMLTVDACVSPDGELTIACHSGGPDWGSGPSGAGKLYQVRYADREHPQPAAVWASGPREVVVAFDRAVDAERFRDGLGSVALTTGEYVAPGDRFETLWPGYAAVQRQKLAPRLDVPVHSAQLTPDGRALILATDPLLHDVPAALTLPGMGRPAPEAAPPGVLPQHAAIDLGFSLHGCDATWRSADGERQWSGWLPHVELEVSRRLTAGSAMHDALWDAMNEPGELTLRGQLQLRDMLRPAVQPGSTLDYELPPEAVTVSFAGGGASGSIRLASSEPTAVVSQDKTVATIQSPAGAAKRIPFEVRLKTGGSGAGLRATWTTHEDDRPRPLPLHRLLLPWVKERSDDAPELPPTRAPELAGGSWARGYREFHGPQAGCSKCHAIHGRGAAVGPPLSNVVHRDYASVLRDVTHPSFAINPDFLTYVVLLKEGRALSGVLKSEGDRVSIYDSQGNVSTVHRDEIESASASPISTMPEGLLTPLSRERMRDLMTFLLTPPPSMPRDAPGARPKPRSRSEVLAALAGAPTAPPTAHVKPLDVVLVAGPKDHGPGEHDYPAWQTAWKELLTIADGVQVSTAWEWPTADQWGRADVVVFYQHGDWNARRAADVDAFLERGGGLVYIHWAIHGRAAGGQFAQRIGLAAGDPIAFRHGDLELTFNREANHPIIRNFTTLHLVDESYWKLAGSIAPDSMLASSMEDAAAQPHLWTAEPRNGRVFVSIPGHYSWTFDDPLFRLLLLRGIAWTAREPVDRLNELVWPGADVANESK